MTALGNKQVMADNLAYQMDRKGVDRNQLCIDLGFKYSTVSEWLSARKYPRIDSIEKMANYFGIAKSKLIENQTTNDTITSNIDAVFTDNIRMIPVYESVSAGFGAFADNTITDYQPVRIVSDSEAAETICIRVTGDSMYPKIEDGDIIQVRKQDSVDSGDIAVMLLDGDEGLVKRVVYGRDWIELHSINPMYPVQRYEGADVQRLRVVGLVRGVFHAF